LTEGLLGFSDDRGEVKLTPVIDTRGLMHLHSLAADSFKRFVAVLFRALWALRGPLAIGLISFVVFYFPEQIREIYSAQAADFPESSTKVVFSFFGVSLLSYFLWSLSRAAWSASAENPPKDAQPLDRAVFSSLCFGICLLPLAGVSLAIKEVSASGFVDVLRYSAQFDGLSKALESEFAKVVTRIDNQSEVLGYALILSLGIAVALLAIVFLRPLDKLSAFQRNPFSPARIASAGILTAVLIAITAAQSSVSLAGQLAVTRAFMTVGTIFILSVFLAILAYFVAASVRAYERWRVPLIALLLATVFAWSYLDTNDNHEIVFEPTKSPYRLEFLKERFGKWFAAQAAERMQLYASRGPGAKYPVYIVAAEGGGLYAANLVAISLARLYSRCPALKNHVFAISGVSGGSLGAGIFNALWAEDELRGQQEKATKTALPGASSSCLPGGEGKESMLEKRVAAYLSEDFFAPLAAAALFPDFFQRFIFAPVPALDRARGFEAALREGWYGLFPKSAGQSNPFGERFLDFSGATIKAPVLAPLLVLNTTHVETGRRYLVTPILFSDSDYVSSFYSIESPPPVAGAVAPDESDAETADISLATAVSLSARFPLILPAGRYRNQGGPYRFADGAYFENSGVETAIDMINSIKETLSTDPNLLRPEFRIIILKDRSDPAQELDALSEFGAPLLTLNRTRVERGNLAIRRAPNVFEKTYVVELQHTVFPMPLGLTLSRSTQSLIKMQIGHPDECDPLLQIRPRSGSEKDYPRQGPDVFVRLAGRLNENRCVLQRILNELM
jgi:hypothetical protein